jgi:hypothetical protein
MASETAQLPADLEVTACNRNERFAAAYLGVHVETLRGWRKRKTGPPWRKLGTLGLREQFIRISNSAAEPSLTKPFRTSSTTASCQR